MLFSFVNSFFLLCFLGLDYNLESKLREIKRTQLLKAILAIDLNALAVSNCHIGENVLKKEERVWKDQKYQCLK